MWSLSLSKYSILFYRTHPSYCDDAKWHNAYVMRRSEVLKMAFNLRHNLFISRIFHLIFLDCG